MRTICAVVLAFEAVAIALAIPVAIQLAGLAPATAGAVWGGLAAAAVLLAALQRHTWAFHAGSALQLLILASGLIVPGMGGLALLGAIFGALWAAGIVLGARTDALNAPSR